MITKADHKEFQSNLRELGFNPGKIDGIPGTKTRQATHDCIQAHQLTPLPGGGAPIPFTTYLEVRKLVDQLRNKPELIRIPSCVTDLTGMAYTGPRNSKRALSSVTSIYFHRTGASITGKKMGDVRYKRWAMHHIGYNPTTKAPIYSSLKAHMGVCPDGEALLVHPLDYLVWNGHGGSPESVGIEIDEPTPGTAKKEDVKFTDAQIQTCFDVALWLIKEVALAGGEVLFWDTHRPYKDTRRFDMGESGYKEIVLELEKKTSVKVRPIGFKKGSGRPIGEAWDSRCKGIPT